MADLEVYLDAAETGATVTADLILAGAVSVAGHPLAEQSAPGVYHAAAPGGLAAGGYTVRVNVNGATRGHFDFAWDGTAEINPNAKLDDLHDFAGLGATPLVTAPGTKTVGTKVVTRTGDGKTTQTDTRTA